MKTKKQAFDTSKEWREITEGIEEVLKGEPIFELEKKYWDVIRIGAGDDNFIISDILKVQTSHISSTEQDSIRVSLYHTNYSYNFLHHLKMDGGVLNYLYNLLSLSYKVITHLKEKYPSASFDIIGPARIVELIPQLEVCNILENRGYRTHLKDEESFLSDFNLELRFDSEIKELEHKINPYTGYESLDIPLNMQKDVSENIKAYFGELIRFLENRELQNIFIANDQKDANKLDENVQKSLLSNFGTLGFLGDYTSLKKAIKKANPKADLYSIHYNRVLKDINTIPGIVLKTLEGVYYVLSDSKTIVFKTYSEVYPL